MGDYNDNKLPEPCMRLDFGGEECASIELGDGTGFMPLALVETLRARVDELERTNAANLEQAETDLVAMRSYAIKLRELLVQTYGFAVVLFGRIGEENVTAGDIQDLNDLYCKLREIGVEV